MLARQQRGGDEYRRLRAVLHRLEDAADGHLGLAEAHVTAHEPVHRARLFHVGLDVGDRVELVLGLDEGKEDSISACQGVSALNAWPSTASRRR